MIYYFPFLILIFHYQEKFECFLFKTKSEIQKIMNENYKEYKAQGMNIISKNNTLSYYNTKLDATIMFYFNKEQKCEYIKTIEDIENMPEKINEFNKNYIRIGPYKWKTTYNQKIIKISIEKEEYNFTVIYQ